jgi:ankyrin repeat protein
LEAIAEDDMVLVASLLSQIRDIDLIKDKYGWPALLCAVKRGNGDIVKMLLEKGANANTMSSTNVSPLILASSDGSVGIVKLLISHGANIETKDSGGNTALMKAAANGHADVVQFLLQQGANVRAKNSGGETPLMLAYDSVKTVNALIRAGANINEVNSFGRTALMYAAYSGHKYKAQVLINSGADVAIRSRENLTALSLAESLDNGVVANIISGRQSIDISENRRGKVIATDVQGISLRLKLKDGGTIDIPSRVSFTISLANYDNTVAGRLTFMLPEESRQKISGLYNIPVVNVPPSITLDKSAVEFDKNMLCPNLHLVFNQELIKAINIDIQSPAIKLPIQNSDVEVLKDLCTWVKMINKGAAHTRGIISSINRVINTIP